MKSKGYTASYSSVSRLEARTCSGHITVCATVCCRTCQKWDMPYHALGSCIAYFERRSKLYASVVLAVKKFSHVSELPKTLNWTAGVHLCIPWDWASPHAVVSLHALLILNGVQSLMTGISFIMPQTASKEFIFYSMSELPKTLNWIAGEHCIPRP